MIDINTIKKSLSQEQLKKIEEIAEDNAYRFFFCNVDDEDFPEDPIDYIYNNYELDDFYYGFKKIGGKCLEIWEPFENYMLKDIVEWLENLIEDNKRLALIAISIGRDNDVIHSNTEYTW